MAPLSHDLAGILLPHDHFGSHLNATGHTVDETWLVCAWGVPRRLDTQWMRRGLYAPGVYPGQIVYIWDVLV